MLDLNISTILLEMANFLILAFVLYRFLFTPLKNTLKKREAESTRTWDQARTAKAEANEIVQQYQEKSNNIDAEIAVRKNEARMIIEQTRQQMLQEVQEEIESLQAQAKETLNQMRGKALQQHRDEISDLASAFVKGIMKDLVSPELQKVYQNEFLDKVSQMDLSAMTQDSAPVEKTFVKVITVDSPSTSYKKQLEEILSKNLPKDLELSYEVNPSLIAGGILQFENELVDGSLNGRIDQLKEHYLELA